jgi:adenine-specific DNA-methyltransferase
MIFDTASIQTMVMLFEKNKIDDNYELDYRKLHGDKLSDVIDLLNHKVTDKTEYLSPVINRAFFTGKYLTFSNNDCILDKMCNTPGVTYLKSDELAQGIVFPQDFLNKKGQEKLGHHNVGDGIFGLSPTELNGLNLMEKELDLIKPYFTSEQIFRYYTSEHNTLWMIYTDSSYKNPHSMNLYPNLKCHLDQFVDILTSDNKPYGLHRARKQRFFIGEKVICQRKCAGRPVFSFSDFDCYVTQTYIVIKSAKWNHEVLTGILNSKIVEFWLLNRGKMQGENFQIDNEPLQQIPLVIPSDKVQDVIAEKVQCIIDLMAKDVSSDITKLEKDIDVITYHLYNITYDEILTIDPETSITKEEYDNYE